MSDLLTCQRDKFSLNEESTYINCAYMSPMLRTVAEVGVQAIMAKNNPGDIKPEDFFTESHKLRKAFARLINAPGAENIAIIPSVSYGVATVAKNITLNRGEKVVVAGEQFPSNYYSWSTLCKEAAAELCVVNAPETSGLRGEAWNEAIIQAIDSTTRVVAISHTHWADGTLFDLKMLRKATAQVGARLIIDGTQSVGALPFDVQEIQPDALICAGYKWLMGPYGIGLAYYHESFFDGLPLEQNWISRHASEDFAGLVRYNNDYQPGALRFDVGERSNFILVPMLLKALEQIEQWRPDRIQHYCHTLMKETLSELNERGFRTESPPQRAHHLVGIRPPMGSIDQIKERLMKENISISVRGNALRIAPHVYNTEEEVYRLKSCLIG